MRSESSASRSDGVSRLSSLPPGTRGVVVGVSAPHGVWEARLAALGVTPGASILVLQTFPGVVFVCDQTEVAVEPAVARTVLVAVGDPGEGVVPFEVPRTD